MLQIVPRPFAFRYQDASPFHQYLVDISVDFEMGWLVSVSTVLQDRGGGAFELSYGIQIYDGELDCSWIEFKRTRAVAAFHPEVKPYVLRIVHASIRKLVGRFRPTIILRRTAEAMPLGFLPERFLATGRLLERCGYELTAQNQGLDRRWSWRHERRRRRGPWHVCASV